MTQVCRHCIDRPPGPRGLCPRCYNAAWRLGCLDAWATPQPARKGPPCSIAGCPRIGRGKHCWCKTHEAVMRAQLLAATPTAVEAWYTEEKDPEPTGAELAEYERRKAEVLAAKMARARP